MAGSSVDVAGGERLRRANGHAGPGCGISLLLPIRPCDTFNTEYLNGKEYPIRSTICCVGTLAVVALQSSGVAKAMLPVITRLINLIPLTLTNTAVNCYTREARMDITDGWKAVTR